MRIIFIRIIVKIQTNASQNRSFKYLLFVEPSAWISKYPKSLALDIWQRRHILLTEQLDRAIEIQQI